MTEDLKRETWFCACCFADEENGSWAHVTIGIDEGRTHCMNCGASNSCVRIPKWAVNSIREQASFVGTRYYPSEEDKQRYAELRYLRSIAPLPEAKVERFEDRWSVQQGNVSTLVEAKTKLEARKKAQRILPYPIPPDGGPAL